MRPDLRSSMTSYYDDERGSGSEYNNSEYYYNPTEEMTNDESSHFEELVQTYMSDVHYTSITQTAFNLTYSMINVGIVGLPFCAYEAGIPLYVTCVLFFTTLSSYISSLLVEMAEDEKVRSLEALSERAFGARGYVLTCLMQLTFSFTIICVTLGEWGSVIPTVIETNFEGTLPTGLVFDVLTDRKFIMIVGSLLALPGCFSRTFSTLSWSSFFTLSTIIVTILWSLYILVRYLDNPDESNGKNVLKVRSLWWTTEVIICFCLSFQQKLFFVFNCLRRRSVGRFAPAVQYSHLFVALLYITFGCVCAVHMTDVTNFKHFNYFKDYKDTSESRAIFDITRTVVSFSLLFTIPVESLVIVTVWRRLWRRYRRHLKSTSYHAHEQHASVLYAPVNHSGGPECEESDDEDMRRRAARVNDRMCCYEMASLLPWHESVDDEDSDIQNDKSLEKANSPHFSSRHTLSTACTTTNNSVERYLRRVDTFDTTNHPQQSSFKSNTTDDNLKAISCNLSESSNGSHGFVSTPPITPTRKKRTVSFQDESTPPRPLASPMNRNDPNNVHNTPHHLRSSLMNSSIHLAAESPHILNQQNNFRPPPPTNSPNPYLAVSQERVSEINLNDGASVASSFLGSTSVFRDVSTSHDFEESTDRRSSVGEIESLKPSTYERVRASLPILTVWALSLVFSLFVYQTVLFSALFITALVTSIFMFMLPSMLYFRLGVKSDFESIPICGILPNRLYMHALQCLGIIFILGNFTGLSMTLYHNFQNNHTNMHM